MQQETIYCLDMNMLPSARLEFFFRWLVWYSVGMYVVEELVVGTEHSREGWPGWLWSERIVAVLFSVEFGLRCYYRPVGSRYPFTFMGLIDLVAIVPFYIGFFVSERSLHLIRTLRTLRLLKVYRYSRGLQLLARGFYKVRDQLRALGFAVFVLIFFTHAAMYEAERYAQPDVFKSLADSFWFTCVTVTTVGYGDMYPITLAGRIVTMLSFLLGITLVGTFTGVMGSAFASVLREDSERLAGLQQQEKAGQALKIGNPNGRGSLCEREPIN